MFVPYMNEERLITLFNDFTSLIITSTKDYLSFGNRKSQNVFIKFRFAKLSFNFTLNAIGSHGSY